MCCDFNGEFPGHGACNVRYIFLDYLFCLWCFYICGNLYFDVCRKSDRIFLHRNVHSSVIETLFRVNTVRVFPCVVLNSLLDKYSSHLLDYEYTCMSCQDVHS